MTDSEPAGARAGDEPVICARLHYDGRELVLTPGAYVFGRSTSCQVILDQALISRRHAVVKVAPDRVTIQDLGSSNGVFVDGERLGPEPFALSDGARLVLGRQQFFVQIDGPADKRRDRVPTGKSVDPTLRDTQAATRTARTNKAERSTEPRAIAEDDAEENTSRVGGLSLMAIVAESALAERPKQAEDMLLKHLYELLGDARKGRNVSAELRETALSCAFKLAEALNKSSWLDFAVDLLAAEPTLLDEARAAALKHAVTAVPGVDAQRLESYAEAVKALPTSYDRIRTLSALEELVKLAH